MRTKLSVGMTILFFVFMNITPLSFAMAKVEWLQPGKYLLQPFPDGGLVLFRTAVKSATGQILQPAQTRIISAADSRQIKTMVGALSNAKYLPSGLIYFEIVENISVAGTVVKSVAAALTEAAPIASIGLLGYGTYDVAREALGNKVIERGLNSLNIPGSWVSNHNQSALLEQTNERRRAAQLRMGKVLFGPNYRLPEENATR